MRARDSISHFVGQSVSVGWSICWLVGLSVGWSVLRFSAFFGIFTPAQSHTTDVVVYTNLGDPCPSIVQLVDWIVPHLVFDYFWVKLA